MLKRFFVLLSIAIMTVSLALGLPASHGTSTAQELSPLKLSGWADPEEGYLIDIEKFYIGDNGDTLWFAVQTYATFSKGLLATQHLYIYIDTDQDVNTSLAGGANDGLGVDRIIEVGYNPDSGKLWIAAHDGQVTTGFSDEVRFDGRTLMAALPLSAIGSTSKFDWGLQIINESNIASQKFLDSLPNDGIGTYTLYSASPGGTGGTGGTGDNTGNNGGTNDDPGGSTDTPSDDSSSTPGGGTDIPVDDLPWAPPGGGAPSGQDGVPAGGIGSDTGVPGGLPNEDNDTPAPDSSNPTGNSGKVTFNDVKATEWFYPYVMTLIENSLVGGYPDGTFKPQNNITRAEFAKIVVSAIGQTPVEGAQSSFKDCANHWARGYIEKAKALNILGGYPDGSFKPNSHITRAEMSKMICLVKGLDTSSSASGFSDCKGHWADTYIAAARKAGYVLGYDSTTFKPDAFATRAEVCKIIYLMIDEE